MEAPPVISIIVPVYNVESYIEGCLRSVFAQKGTIPTELILVDDCCSDSSMAIAERVAADAPSHIAIQFLRHSSNRGASAARNTGTAAAKGDYILYLDSDDLLTENSCFLLLHEAQARHSDITMGKIQLEPDRNIPYYNMSAGEWKGSDSARAIFKEHILPVPWNKLIRHSFITENQLSFKEGITEEDELWIAHIALLQPHIVIIQQSTYIYRIIRAGSVMNTHSIKHTLSCLTVAKEAAELFHSLPAALQDESRKWALKKAYKGCVHYLPSARPGFLELIRLSYILPTFLKGKLGEYLIKQNDNLRIRKTAVLCSISPFCVRFPLLFIYLSTKIAHYKA